MTIKRNRTAHSIQLKSSAIFMVNSLFLAENTSVQIHWIEAYSYDDGLKRMVIHPEILKLI